MSELPNTYVCFLVARSRGLGSGCFFFIVEGITVLREVSTQSSNTDGRRDIGCPFLDHSALVSNPPGIIGCTSTGDTVASRDVDFTRDDSTAATAPDSATLVHLSGVPCKTSHYRQTLSDSSPVHGVMEHWDNTTPPYDDGENFVWHNKLIPVLPL